MINTIQSYKLNNTVVEVDLARITELSEPSRNILSAQLHAALPPAIQTTAPLTGRIQELEALSEQLTTAKANSGRDKLITYLKTAVLAALLAGTIFLALYVAPPVFLIGAFLFAIGSIICLIDAYSRLGMKQNEGIAFGALFGLGLIIPLIEGLSRVSRLEGSLKQSQDQVEADLSRYKRENEQLLPQAHRFYSEQAPELLLRLGQKIEDTERGLEEMQRMAERSEAGERDMRDRIALLRKTSEELRGVIAFYRQFDAI